MLMPKWSSPQRTNNRRFDYPRDVLDERDGTGANPMGERRSRARGIPHRTPPRSAGTRAAMGRIKITVLHISTPCSIATHAPRRRELSTGGINRFRIAIRPLAIYQPTYIAADTSLPTYPSLASSLLSSPSPALRTRPVNLDDTPYDLYTHTTYTLPIRLGLEATVLLPPAHKTIIQFSPRLDRSHRTQARARIEQAL
jgi:hypothetical protein